MLFKIQKCEYNEVNDMSRDKKKGFVHLMSRDARV